jgi:hypothetical protein
MSGSGHTAQFATSKAAFTVTGRTAEWQRITDAGNTVTKIFCPTCGSPLYGTTSRNDGIVMVVIGALDTPAAVVPDRIIFAEEAPPWDRITLP